MLIILWTSPYSYKSDVGSYVYTYGDKPHAVRSTSGLVNITLQYDANGNMTNRTDSTTGKILNITWNEDNKPATITVNGTAVNFIYDGNGNRVRKIKGSNSTYYFGDAYETRNTVGIIHLFANHQRLASIRTDGKNQYYHGNHLGSASVITDQNGNKVETIEYFPYGTYRDRQDPGGSFPNVNYTFTDQEDDDETGLYNYDARLYDPQLGRFISADSIVPKHKELQVSYSTNGQVTSDEATEELNGDLQGLNRYSYCLNNPLVYADPSGHDSEIAQESWDASTRYVDNEESRVNDNSTCRAYPSVTEHLYINHLLGPGITYKAGEFTITVREIDEDKISEYGRQNGRPPGCIDPEEGLEEKNPANYLIKEGLTNLVGKGLRWFGSIISAMGSAILGEMLNPSESARPDQDMIYRDNSKNKK